MKTLITQKVLTYLIISLSLVTAGIVTYGVVTRSTSSTPSHPYLLFSSADVSGIEGRVNASSAVQGAFNGMTNSATSGYWWDNLVNASFHYSIEGDTESRDRALRIFNQYTQGSSRYSYPTTLPNRTFDLAMPCSSLALSYDLLYPVLSSTQKSNGRGLLREWGGQLYARYNTNPYLAATNFDTGLFGCLGLIGLTLQGESDSVLVSSATTWYDFSARALRDEYFNFSYNPGGDYIEGNRYQYYGFGPATLFAASLERFNGTDITSSSGVRNMWDFLTYVYMTDGAYARYGDNRGTSIYGEALYFLKKRVEVNDPRVSGYLWLWNQLRPNGYEQVFSEWNTFDFTSIVLYYPLTVTPENPESSGAFPEGKIFPSLQTNDQGSTTVPGGMVSLRDGWGDDNVSVWLVNRWRNQIHQGYDPNHLLVSAYGQPMFTFENHKPYRPNGSLRARLDMYNTVSSSARYGNPLVSTAGSASLGMFTRFDSQDAADFVVSDSSYPLSDFSTQPIPDTCIDFVPNGPNTHKFSCANTSNVTPFTEGERAVFLVKDLFEIPYVLVYDIVDSNKDDAPLDYYWQGWFPKNAINVGGSAVDDQPFSFQVGNVTMSTYALYPESATVSVVADRTMLSNRDDNPMRITSSGVPTGEFLVLSVPVQVGMSEPTVTETSATDLSLTTMVSGNMINEIYFNKTSGVIDTGTVKTNGKVLVLSYENDTLVGGIIHNGTYVEYEDERVFLATSETTQIFETDVTPPPDPNLTGLRNGYYHPGIDIKPLSQSASSKNVYSTHAGFVTYAGPAPSYIAERGWMVQIESDLNRDNVPDVITRYTHLAPNSLMINDVRNVRLYFGPEYFAQLGGAFDEISKLPYGYGPYVSRNQLLGLVGDTGSPGRRHIQYEILTDRYRSLYGIGLDTDVPYACLDSPYTNACSSDAGRPGFFFPDNAVAPARVQGPVYSNAGMVTPPPPPPTNTPTPTPVLPPSTCKLGSVITITNDMFEIGSRPPIKGSDNVTITGDILLRDPLAYASGQDRSRPACVNSADCTIGSGVHHEYKLKITQGTTTTEYSVDRGALNARYLGVNVSIVRLNLQVPRGAQVEFFYSSACHTGKWSNAVTADTDKTVSGLLWAQVRNYEINVTTCGEIFSCVRPRPTWIPLADSGDYWANKKGLQSGYISIN